MNMKKILLNKSKGKESVNKNEIIPIEIDRNISFFHDEILNDTVDMMQVYNDEKDNSSKHRFIFTLYPVFTNVLFNKLTEIIYEEGSNNVKVLDNTNGLTNLAYTPVSTEKLTRMQGIRNTEYTDKRYKLTYHCGLDIFNNHLLRAKEHISVQKRNNNSNNVMKKCNLYYGTTNTFREIDPFNTIGDFNRTYYGDKDISLIMPNENQFFTNVKNAKSSPLYIYDTINSFNDSCDNIERKDGWIGFTNPTTLKIPIREHDDGNDYYINKLFNNKEGCEFIDMCPERDLFSFLPKRNLYRKRLEYNWGYFLTYPYKNEYNDGKVLIGKGSGLPLVKFTNTQYYIEYNSDNGISLLMFRSAVRHNLKKSDFVNIKIYGENGEKTIKCNIVNIGNLDGNFIDRYFSIRKSDIEDYIDERNTPKRFLKIVNGFECDYYFRKFKKIDGKYDSAINNLAFAKTIYNDEISQIVYTDDVNTNNYIDNLGRPLTEIYLTIIKKNQGYKLWYEDEDYSNSEIEYSHVFGKLTSGLDLPYYVPKDMPVIRYQHNINNGVKFVINNDEHKILIKESSFKLEDDITCNNNEFYGDLVEFDITTQNETILEDIFYRFNTAQRETSNNKYNTIFYDEIKLDVYDKEYIDNKTRINENKLNEGFANLYPEGYIYKPHYKIKIGEFDNVTKQSSHNKMDIYNMIVKSSAYIKIDKKLEIGEHVFIKNFNNSNETYEIVINSREYADGTYGYNVTFVNNNIYPNDSLNVYYINIPGTTPIQIKSWYLIKGNEITFNTIDNYSLMPNDIIILTDYDKIYKYKVNWYLKKNDIYECNISILDNKKNDSDLNSCVFFKYNLTIPEYSYILPNNTGIVLWKELKMPSKWTFMDELFNIPFTNGAFYHHTNINFYVRRQDPFQEYGMITEGNKNNKEIYSPEFDFSYDEYNEKNDTTCF